MKDLPIRVLVWDENATHVPKDVYPENIRGAVAAGLMEMGGQELRVRTAHQDEAEQGLSAAALAETDVLMWWGHVRHKLVADEAVERIFDRVHHHAMGLIALHSAHYSKTFQRVLNCNGHLKGGWREDDMPEEVRVCAPHHPIAKGVTDFTLAKEEMYGAPFEVPPPAVLVLQSYFPAGREYFPSGACWSVGNGIDTDFTSGPGKGIGQGEGCGRVFYFRPGHETAPTYYNPMVQRVLFNAVRWAAGRE